MTENKTQSAVNTAAQMVSIITEAAFRKVYGDPATMTGDELAVRTRSIIAGPVMKDGMCHTYVAQADSNGVRLLVDITHQYEGDDLKTDYVSHIGDLDIDESGVE